MMDIGTLITVALAFWVVVASPGPANIASATVAMKYGRKPSLIFGLGLSIGLTFWGLLAATGMGAALQASIGLLIGLKVFGACYLLWLAWQSAISAIKPQPSTARSLPYGNWFLRGLMLNLSNPKAVIAWMAALSVGLDPSDTVASVASATLICIVVAFANGVFYAMVFSANGMMLVYERSRRLIDGAVAALFSIAAFTMLRSAFSR